MTAPGTTDARRGGKVYGEQPKPGNGYIDRRRACWSRAVSL